MSAIAVPSMGAVDPFPGFVRPDRSRVTPVTLQNKQLIIKNLIDGRHGLFEAADQFRALDARAALQDDETVCRTVIGWVGLALADRPELAESFSERLELQLATYLDRLQRSTATK